MAESGQEDTLTIPFRLPSLNEWIAAERGNRFGANALKQSTQRDIAVFIHNAYVQGTLHRHEEPCTLDLHWIEGNSRRDLDNVSFAIKFIQDALVEKGVFPDDSRKYIQEIRHTVETRKNEYGVIVKIKEK